MIQNNDSFEKYCNDLEVSLVERGIPRTQMNTKTAKNIINLIAADNGIAVDLLNVHIGELEKKISEIQRRYENLFNDIDDAKEEFNEIKGKANIISSFDKSFSDPLALNAIKMYYAILDYSTVNEHFDERYSSALYSKDAVIRAAAMITSAYLCGAVDFAHEQEPIRSGQVSIYD